MCNHHSNQKAGGEACWRDFFKNLRPTWRRVDEAENTPLGGSEVQESNNQVK